MQQTNTRVKELEVKERTKTDLVILWNVLTNTKVDMVELTVDSKTPDQSKTFYILNLV